jgi:hypothetical protein
VDQALLIRSLQETGYAYAYAYMEATYLHGRLGKALQVCSRAVVVAMGVMPTAAVSSLALGVRPGERRRDPPPIG